MDELPELPFEKVLSYLGLKDLLKSRAVSRRWRMVIDSFRMKTLALSSRLSRDFIFGKDRLISGTFAKNFIISARIDLFLSTFAPTILSTVRHLRICHLEPNEETRKALASTINLLAQLEQLDIIDFNRFMGPMLISKLELNLPFLNGILLDNVIKVEQLTLITPKLRKIKVLRCFSLRLDLVHGESVERLIIEKLSNIEVNKLKRLEYLCCGNYPESLDQTLLSSLENLKEIHLNYTLDGRNHVTEIFEQKQRYRREDLKIYRLGCLLNGRENPMGSRLHDFNEAIAHLGGQSTNLVDEIPLCPDFAYSAIERLAPGLELSLLSRFTDTRLLMVNEQVQDVQRFLNFLKNFGTITSLCFECGQPQELFDRLPEYCAVQFLITCKAVSDFRFLLRLKNLVHLEFFFPIDIKIIRKICESVSKELPFLDCLGFQYLWRSVFIKIGRSKKYEVWISSKKTEVPDLNAAIRFIVGSVKERKRGPGA